MADNIAVEVGECRCPGTPHPDGDIVYLRPTLGLADGTTVQRLIVEANQNRSDNAELSGKLAEAYLMVGVAAWNLVDAKGKAIPVTRDTTLIKNGEVVRVPGTIRAHLLDDFTRSASVSDAADDLYMGPVLLPLVKKAQASSATSQTNGSTSATSPGSPKSPKRPRRSSISTIPTADTAKISA